MGHDVSAAVGSLLRKPQHRADCSDFYCNPEDKYVGMRASIEVVDAIEDAAQRSGRTWNKQLMFTIQVCRGVESVAADDERTVNDWRTLMAETRICLNGDWLPFRIFFPHMSREVPH